MASSLISGNGIKGTAGMLEAAAGTPGLLSGYQGAGSALKNRIAGSGIGQYFGSVFSSLGSFGSTLGNTKTGGFLSGLLGKAGGALGNLTMPLRPGHRRHRCCGDHSRQHHPTEPIRPAG